MKRLSFLFLLVLLLSCHHKTSPRSAAIRLSSKIGSCSGTQIKAPSGKNYILTAAHCAALAEDDDAIMAEAPGKRPIPVSIIEVSKTSDLMLLTPLPGMDGIDVADSDPRVGDSFTSYTHGHGLDTYKDVAEYIQQKVTDVPVSEIQTEDQEKECLSLPKNKVIEIPSFFGTEKVCALHINSYIARSSGIVPGSSGGEVVNDRGELTAVAYASDGYFALFVTLTDIKAFLDAY